MTDQALKTVYCYSNNGFSSRLVMSDHTPGVGEVIFDHAPDEEELTEAFAGYTNTAHIEDIKQQIRDLEASQTSRRVREAGSDDAGGTSQGRAWLSNLSSQIAALRSQL